MANQGESSDGGPGKVFYTVLALLAVGGVAALWMARGGDGSAGASGGTPAPVSTAEADPGAGVMMGPEDAPVTVVEFADYQCPHCASFQGFAGKLIKQEFVREKGMVRWFHFDFPLGTFPNSVPAAVAARCAGNQGAFWEMHDWLLANQDQWGREGDPTGVFVDQAERMGLEAGRYETCVEERRPMDEIRASRAYGSQVGVDGTPKIFVNGKMLPGVPSYETLAETIRRAADSVRASAAGSGGAASGS